MNIGRNVSMSTTLENMTSLSSGFNVTLDEATILMNNHSSTGDDLMYDENGTDVLEMFFSTYQSSSRLAVETCLAFMATFLNMATLIAMRNARYHRSKAVYNSLFVNLSVANIFTCVLVWLCNNVILLFYRQFRAMMISAACDMFLYLSAAVFVSSAFGIVSTVTMLGFTTVQYFAITDPLHHQSILRKRKVYVFIACSWITSLFGGILPFFVMLYITHHRPCDENLLNSISKISIYGANFCVALVCIVFVVIVSLCMRIYIEIRKIGKNVTQHRPERNVMKSEKRAFVTIVILVVTTATLVIPYTIVYVVSLNSEVGFYIQNRTEVIYYMMLLPYFKFLTDPLIYGLRMREFKEGCMRIGAKCGFRYCACWKIDHNILSRGHYPSYYLQAVNSAVDSSA